MMRRIIIVLLMAFSPALTLAHDPFATNDESQWSIIISAIILLVIWGSYQIGSCKLWPGKKRWVLFQVTMIIISMTIFGPLDEWAESNTAAHMTQHMLMMVVIAPLWVLTQPLPQFSKATSPIIVGFFLPLLRIVRYPMFAAALHGMVIWFWHAPKFYLLALEHPWWHVVEHACFIVTAILFWWSVLRSTRYTTARGLLALLFTLMHTGFLGAILTFAQVSLYGHHRTLLSQQMAGLIMWVVGAIPYLIAVYWCGQRWFQQLQFHDNT